MTKAKTRKRVESLTDLVRHLNGIATALRVAAKAERKGTASITFEDLAAEHAPTLEKCLEFITSDGLVEAMRPYFNERSER